MLSHLVRSGRPHRLGGDECFDAVPYRRLIELADDLLPVGTAPPPVPRPRETTALGHGDRAHQPRAGRLLEWVLEQPAEIKRGPQELIKAVERSARGTLTDRRRQH